MSKTIYCPFLSEDFTFCDVFTCTEMAAWICYPHGAFTHPVLLCDQHKQERWSEGSQPIQSKIEQIETKVKSALQDVDPNDTDAFYHRCSEILEDIHENRL